MGHPEISLRIRAMKDTDRLAAANSPHRPMHRLPRAKRWSRLHPAVIAGAVAATLWIPVPALSQQRDLDVVLVGGRVMDPETGLDAVRNVGLRGNRIATITAHRLDGRLRASGVRVDATGLIVSPGFIDLHAHGQSQRVSEFQAHDGVTTALDLESQ